MTNTSSTTNLRRAGGAWIIGTVDGLDVQAKAFTEPSHYGMSEDARISVLFVRIPGGIVLYDYDRLHLSVNYLNEAGLAMIVSAVAGAIQS